MKIIDGSVYVAAFSVFSASLFLVHDHSA